MSKKVLVLNQDYTAFSVCSAPKAFLLVYLNKADLLVESSDGCLRSISESFSIPSVIRLHKYVYLPYRGIMLTRQNIFRRDFHQCQYCGTTENLTLDHVMPKSRNGKTSWDNLTTACRNCNTRKGDQTPQEANLTLRTKPFKPSFLMFIRNFSENIDAEWLPFLGKEKIPSHAY